MGFKFVIFFCSVFPSHIGVIIFNILEISKTIIHQVIAIISFFDEVGGGYCIFRLHVCKVTAVQYNTNSGW